jgi:hypothetical protein
MIKHKQNFQIEYPCEVSFWQSNQQRRSKFQKANIKLSQDGVKLFLKDEELHYSFEKIFAEAIQVRTKLLIYPNDGPMLLICFPKKYSHYGLLNVIKWYKQALKGETDDDFSKRSASTFLGL